MFSGGIAMQHKPSRRSRFQRFVAMRPISMFFAFSLHHIDRLVFRLTGGRACALSWILQLPVVNVTTTGAKTGRRRTIPLLAIPDDEQRGRFAVIASNFGKTHAPGWYFNMKAHPLVTCLVHGQTHQYRASEVFEAEYRCFWDTATSIFAGYYTYKARANRHIPIIALTPTVNGSDST
jgi:deazaflavin-dependent oxidoreductase (nitroreductase family)